MCKEHSISFGRTQIFVVRREVMQTPGKIRSFSGCSGPRHRLLDIRQSFFIFLSEDRRPK